MSVRATHIIRALVAIVTTGTVEAVMIGAVECVPIRFTEGGTLRAIVEGRERLLTLRGVFVPAESAADANRFVERLRARTPPPRCVPVHASWPEPAVPAEVTIEYLAWRDKTGDVWEDFAGTLVDEGLARASGGAPPDGDDYRARERRARETGRGLWSNPQRGVK